MTVMGLYMLGFLPGWGGYSVALGVWVILHRRRQRVLMFVNVRGEQYKLPAGWSVFFYKDHGILASERGGRMVWR